MRIWESITRPGVTGVNALAWEGPPRVYLEVVNVPGELLLERRIYAIFRWPNTTPRPLILRREVVPVGVGLSDPMKLAKAALEAEWAEHEGWGEKDILREIWAKPLMSPAERAELEARHAHKQAEARERAAKLINQRKELTER